MQGSTRTVTANTGSCAAWYTYTDFGETTVHEEQTGFQQAICYTGGVYDEGTGLYYLNARHYDPETGRFLSRDTYRGESDTPSTLHLYLYCANDPVNYVDPSGHFVMACGWGWGFTFLIDLSSIFYVGIDQNLKLCFFTTKNVGIKIGTGSTTNYGKLVQVMVISNPITCSDLKGVGVNFGASLTVG